MNLTDCIDGRIRVLEERLATIRQFHATEMAKKARERQYKLLTFLHRERCVYEFALAELAGLRSEVIEQKTETQPHA